MAKCMSWSTDQNSTRQRRISKTAKPHARRNLIPSRRTTLRRHRLGTSSWLYKQPNLSFLLSPSLHCQTDRAGSLSIVLLACSTVASYLLGDVRGKGGSCWVVGRGGLAFLAVFSFFFMFSVVHHALSLATITNLYL